MCIDHRRVHVSVTEEFLHVRMSDRLSSLISQRFGVRGRRSAGLGTVRDERERVATLPEEWRPRTARVASGFAPGRTRTCDPRLRSSAKGGNQGQHNAAAPDFVDVLSNPRPLETTPSRYALSVICQSTFARRCEIARSGRVLARRRRKIRRFDRQVHERRRTAPSTLDGRQSPC